MICDTVFALLVLGKELVVSTEANVYFDLENPCARYCNTRDVGIRVDAVNFKSGQIRLEYDPDCAEIMDWIPNREYFDSTIDRSTPPGEEWITFYAVDPHESLTGDYLIGTLKIHCTSKAECTTTLDFVTSGQMPSALFDNHGYEIPAIWKDGTFSCIETCPDDGDDGDDDGDDGDNRDDDGDECDPDGTCGDVAPSGGCDGLINMGDVGLLHNFVGHPGKYTLCCCDNWCGDVAPVDPDDPAVTCDGLIDMGDVGLLHNYIAYPTYGYYLCCQEAGTVSAALTLSELIDVGTAKDNPRSSESINSARLDTWMIQPAVGSSGLALYTGFNFNTGTIILAQNRSKVYIDPPISYTSPDDSEEIEIRVDATSFKSGQLMLQYNPTGAEVVNWEMNENDFSGTWNSDTSGEEWITFLARERALNGDYLVGTLTMQTLCDDECSNSLDFTDASALFNDWGRRITVTWSGGSLEVSAESEDEGGSASDWPLIGGLIAVVFAVILFLFVILLRRNRQMQHATKA